MRFNKRHYFAHLSNVCQKHDISRSDVYVISGGAMVYYGIRELTGDIDVFIPPNVFDKLARNTGVEPVRLPPVGSMSYVDTLSIDGVEFHRDENFDQHRFKVHKGFLIQYRVDILLYKLKLARVKDVADIKLLKDEWKLLNEDQAKDLQLLLS